MNLLVLLLFINDKYILVTGILNTKLMDILNRMDFYMTFCILIETFFHVFYNIYFMI